MAKPLDGIALQAYFRRLGYQLETQDLLLHIRNSPPSRTPGTRRGNMPVWYPSKKMRCIIKAESAKVEFAFLQQAEHDDDVLEVWDQPPSIPLEYADKWGRVQRCGQLGTRLDTIWELNFLQQSEKSDHQEDMNDVQIESFPIVGERKKC